MRKMTKFAPLRIMLFVLLLMSLTALTGAGIIAAQDQLPTPSAADDDIINDTSHPPFLGGYPAAPKTGPRARPAPANPGVAFPSAVDAPTIIVWYGTNQTFGQNGDPQKWVNIVGNVTVPSPATLGSLTYKLANGPTRTLQVAPNGSNRLNKSGDFNIDIDYTDLQPGNNNVTITAIDTGGGTATANVIINYQPKAGNWTPGTYTTNFATATQVNQVAQVIDGNWVIDGGKARPTAGQTGYDRLIAVGDISWRDYTVTVPVTVHDMNLNQSPAFGMIIRWQGHFDEGSGKQPVPGWRRLGAMAWYRYNKGEPPTEGLQILNHRGLDNGSAPFTPEYGKTYMMKVRVVSNANPPNTAKYSFKVWDATTTEPAGWNIESTGQSGENRNGSIVLLAHYADVSFGNVTVELASTEPKPELTINVAGTGSGNVTADPQQTTYRFGEDVVLTAAPAAGSNFVNWQGDAGGSSPTTSVEMFADRSVTAVFSNPNVQTPLSDDFSGCQLNTSLWAVTDPLGDTTMTMTGSQLQIAIPSGGSHDFWPTSNYNAPRIMQYAENNNFAVEVKFDSTMATRNQMQGILIAGGDNTFIRYVIVHNGNTYRLQIHTIAGGVATARYDQPITIDAPMYLKLQRGGKFWLPSYHAGGTNNWITPPDGNFELDMVVNSVGVVVGTSGNNPAFTSLVDYFFNSSSPINPEDTDRKLNIITTGNGTVNRSPQKDNYACDEVVQLTAVPEAGYKFSSWGGDLSGTQNPASLTMNGTKNVVANFVPDQQYTVTVSASGGGTVTKSPPKDTYSPGEQVVITAEPQLGYMFTNWSGDASGTTNPLTVTVNNNMNIVGNFTVAPARVLTLNTSGNGTITPNPAKTAYSNGESVTLTASPGPNWSFVSWSGGATGTANPTTIVMDGDKTVTATFLENIYTLTTAVDPAGSGSITVSPPKSTYYQGEVVTLTPMPADGFTFAGWAGDLTGTANPGQLTMTKSSTVTAKFVPAGTFTVNVAVNGQGTVLRNPPGTEFAYGTELTLTAVPGPDMEFISWSGDLESTESSVTFTVTKDYNITASFGSKGIYSLTLLPDPNGTIERTPVRELYGQNEQVTLTAVPAMGYVFAGWGNDLVGSNNPMAFNMTKNMTVSAIFVEAPLYNVNVTTNGPGSVVVDPPGAQFHAGTTVNLTATPSEGYIFAGWSGDVTSNVNPYSLLVDSDKNIVANFAEDLPIVSDDFAGCGTLNPMWSWVDPNGAATYKLTGSQLQIVVPPVEATDPNYDIWQVANNSARLMQEVANTNFEAVLKFDSLPTQGSQTQGVLIEDNAGSFIRIDLFHDGQSLRFFGGTVTIGQSSRQRFNGQLDLTGVDSPQVSIRVQRIGDTFRNFYRLTDDGAWTSFGGTNFRFPLEVARVGVFAATPGKTAPGHTVLFDYFFNSAAPIVAEDANAPSVQLDKVGQGTVTMNPAAGPYTCGQQVRFSATPSAGWRFQNYSGALNGSNANQTLTITGAHTVRATFVTHDTPTGFTLMLPVVKR